MAEPPPTAIRPSQPWAWYTATAARTRLRWGGRGLVENGQWQAGQGVQRFCSTPQRLHAGVGHDQGAGDADPIAFLAQQLHRAKLKLDLGHVVDESHGVRWMWKERQR